MTIYDKVKLKCRTFVQSINALFDMGKDLETVVSGKQDTLVSGTNIKSINGSTILGEGNLVIQGDNPGIESGDAGKVLKVNSLEDGTEWSDSLDIKVPDTPTGGSYAVNKTYVDTGINNAKPTKIDFGTQAELIDVLDNLAIGDIFCFYTIGSGWAQKSVVRGDGIVIKDQTDNTKIIVCSGVAYDPDVYQKAYPLNGLKYDTTAKTLTVKYIDGSSVSDFTIDFNNTVNLNYGHIIKMNFKS